ncbi:PREDICTED: phenolic glucoside malonyltransferase 1-like [Prunus mume]|uniref:Phenolic glucoside malonyltransferase 1-like n=1 Tax=Prunus mume TaxID=102107 RepID=A0ABM0NWU8_PRUMU|nr:PREDICTED: phenolic glucoside malonyltransferase 1-like [Prunus mume]
MAEPNSVVKVIEICRVAPEPQEVPLPPATPWFLPELTFFDLFWLRFPPFQSIFFYELPPSSDPTPLFFDSILPKLKASLSLTLQHFLPLAGSLTWPQTSHKPLLNYVQGDAVSLTIAHYSGDHRSDYFDHLSSCNEFVEAIKYHPLVPKLAISHEKAAAMALQITLFPSRGFSMGTCMHHAILDGKSSTLFLKSWAHLCKHGGLLLPDKLKPFYGVVIKDPAGLESIYLNRFLNLDRPENRSLMCALWEAPVPPDSVRGTFEFTSTNIQALRHLVMKKQQQQQQQHQSVHFSTFSLTCAYAWVCLAKSKAKEIRGEKIAMIFSIDCRSRLDPPLPANYFGNGIAGGRVVAETKGLFGEDGLVLAVHAIREAIKGLDNKGILNGAENWVSTLYSSDAQTNYFILTSVAGSNRFQIYDTDFGWGRPRRTEVVSIDKTGRSRCQIARMVVEVLRLGWF